MLAAIPCDYSLRPNEPEYTFIEIQEKLEQYMSSAEDAMDQGMYYAALWAFRSAFALLLVDFRVRSTKLNLPLMQRCSLYADLCRAWSEAQKRIPLDRNNIAAMYYFIEGQRRRTEFFACA